MTQDVVSDPREEKGKVIALNNKIYRIINSDVFYVESQSVEDMVYYIMFNTEKDFCWCSCRDHSIRGLKCKHLHAVEYAIRKATYIETDKLPSGVKKDNSKQLQYTEDKYDF
jgi:predicted nucleic acid-binding Zn finger protein